MAGIKEIFKMKRRRCQMARTLLIFLVALSLIGCATPRTKQTQIQELKTRIAALQRELQTKDEQISSLEEELYQKEAGAKRRIEEKGLPGMTPKRIQTALKNAGFYKGPIDGQIGQQTKQAIKEFQKANGFKADGIVGKRTWEKLGRYLN